MMADESQVELLLRQGISAVQAGRVEEARELLLQVLDLDRHNEKAWLWMSAITDDEDRVVCLKNVLAINPRNEHARLGLEALLGDTVTVAQDTPVISDQKPRVWESPPPPEAEWPADAVTADQDSPVISGQEPLFEEIPPPTEVRLPASAEAKPRRTDRNCAMYFGLGALALLTIVVCGVALLLGGMVVTSGPLQAESTNVLARAPLDTPDAPTSTPTSTLSSAPTFTPTVTKTPLPTNTLVVPDARIPGFPIVNEGAYPEIEARVSELRELESLHAVQRQAFTRFRLEDYLYDVYRQEEYARDLAVSERIYRVLGLIEGDYDLRQMLIETQREGIAGLYDSEREEIYLILDRYTSDLWLEVTFAHEFTHALQDQHFDLDSLQGQALTTDARLAFEALIEGDATLVMIQYAFEYLFEAEVAHSDLLQAIQEVEQGQYQDAPGVVRETARFPYDQGVIFAAALVEHGGWAQLNQAFRNLPQTTEQIMHPDKYLAGEGVHIPEVGDLRGALGPGWVELRRDVVGELFIRVYLGRELGSEEALVAGEGWEGDSFLFLENEEQDRYALALRTTWDSTANAEEFFSSYLTFTQRDGAGSRVVDEPQRKEWQFEGQVIYLSRQGQDVLLVLTSDEEIMDLVLPEFPTF
jgi:hypothetical protein